MSSKSKKKLKNKSKKNPSKLIIQSDKSKHFVYTTLDDSIEIYKIEVLPSFVCVSQIENNCEDETQKFYKPIGCFQYTKLWKSDCTLPISFDYKYYPGCAVLISDKPNHYIYFGSEIFEFEYEIPIISMHSITDQLRIPFTYLLDEKGNALLTSFAFFDNSKDGYFRIVEKFTHQTEQDDPYKIYDEDENKHPFFPCKRSFPYDYNFEKTKICNHSEVIDVFTTFGRDSGDVYILIVKANSLNASKLHLRNNQKTFNEIGNWTYDNILKNKYFTQIGMEKKLLVGCAVLINQQPNKYIYFGNNIFEFEYNIPIDSIHSIQHDLNDGYPYTYLIDKEGNAILTALTETAPKDELFILKNFTSSKIKNPYQIYDELESVQNIPKIVCKMVDRQFNSNAKLISKSLS